MSVHYAMPHLFQSADLEELDAASAAELEYGAEPDYDHPELYGEEEGVRVLYQQDFLSRD